MTSINRAKTTIEELKKLFSKGKKPSEEDFARLIDTLNDEIDSELFYTKEEVNNLIELKANLEHSHIEYLNSNNYLTDEDIYDLLNVFKGLKTVDEVLKTKK